MLMADGSTQTKRVWRFDPATRGLLISNADNSIMDIDGRVIDVAHGEHL